MSRWWENDRSRLAARIRGTRRRLRASFRAARDEKLERLSAKLVQSTLEANRKADARTEEAVAALDMIGRVRVSTERGTCSTSLALTWELADEALLREDPAALLACIARVVGLRVEREILKADVPALVARARAGEWRKP